jgi:AbrB family looped-hinge helix DNA binding protein
MESSIVTTKGQVVIPSRLRKKYKIKNGTRIQFQEQGDGIKLMPITPELIRSKAGFLGTKGRLLKALMEEKKKEREL